MKYLRWNLRSEEVEAKLELLKQELLKNGFHPHPVEEDNRYVQARFHRIDPISKEEGKTIHIRVMVYQLNDQEKKIYISSNSWPMPYNLLTE